MGHRVNLYLKTVRDQDTNGILIARYQDLDNPDYTTLKEAVKTSLYMSGSTDEISLNEVSFVEAESVNKHG